MANPAPVSSRALVDGFGRRIDYLRLSLTDRCDLRCRYCMSEAMSFLPREKVLSLEELIAVADAFVARGIRRIRLTGGEPLARRGASEVARAIGRHLATGDLDELTLTTNATRLADHAAALRAAGIRRINVSLDSRDPARFRAITRTGDVTRALDGIDAAKAEGLAIKINMVALRGFNEAEIAPMLQWCAEEGHDLALIETMPLGAIEEDRTDRYLPLDGVRRDLVMRFGLVPDTHRTGGPARYMRVPGTMTRIGFITPLTHNFCDGCNRVRVSADGGFHLCLGHDDRIDLCAAMREGGPDALDAAIDAGLAAKPRRHSFTIGEGAERPAVARHMSVTGG